MRMSQFTASLRAALEAQSEPEVVIAAPEGGVEVVPVAAEIDDADDCPQDHLLAAGDAADDVDTVIEESDELAKATTGLESILDMVRGEPNGLDPVGAKFVTLAIEAYVGSWNIPVSLVPSSESFGGTLSRRESTATLEANVGEVLKHAYEYVKEMFLKVLKAVKQFFQHAFGAAEMLVRRAKKLEVRAAALKGEPRSKEIDVGPLLNRLACNGKVPHPLGNLFKNIDDMLAMSRQLGEKRIAAELAAVHAINVLSDATDANFDGLLKNADDTYNARAMETPFLKASGDGFQSVVFPGEVIYTAEKHDGSLRYGKKKVEGKAQPSTFATLSISDIQEVAKGASALANLVAMVKKETPGMIDDHVKSPLLESLKANGNLSAENQRKAAKAVQRYVGDLQTAYRQGMGMFADAISAATAAVSIAEKSAAQYEPKSAFASAYDKGHDIGSKAGHSAVSAVKDAADAIKDKVGGKKDEPEAAAV